jgi:hypothetical protein
VKSSFESRPEGVGPDDFVPEADALDQQREVSSGSEVLRDEEESAKRPLEYPRRIPVEAPEADVLEQAQSVDSDDDRWG